jgi:hypothetical protein
MANEARIRRQPRAHVSPAIPPNFFHRSVAKWQQTSQLLEEIYRHTTGLVAKYWPFLFHHLFSVLPIKVDYSHEPIFQCPPKTTDARIQTWRSRDVTICELAEPLRSFLSRSWYRPVLTGGTFFSVKFFNNNNNNNNNTRLNHFSYFEEM